MDLIPNWSQFGRGNRGEEKEKRRREEEEEEEEEEGRRSSKPRSRGMELTLGMNSCMKFHTIVWLLVVSKPRVC